MNGNVDERIRGLAQPLWESAARPYGMAMDFWLMAERMVMEMVSATARLQSKAVMPPSPPLGELPDGMPVQRVREMAECMWESAGRQYGMAQDFWLAAERHVLAMLRLSAFPAAGAKESKDASTLELGDLAPAAYLERIRRLAYFYWERAGRSYGNALDCWLQAERDMLKMMSAATEGGSQPSPPADGVSPAGAPKGAAEADLLPAATTTAAPAAASAQDQPAPPAKAADAAETPPPSSPAERPSRGKSAATTSAAPVKPRNRARNAAA
ncbi:MAG: DUF2934 domain-containing protein [Rhodospirillales bacterium]